MAISQLRRTLRSLARFSKNIFEHPGTWVLGLLLAVGVGFAMPAIAPALVLVALGCTIATLVASVFQIKNFLLLGLANKKKIWTAFTDAHPFQAIAIGLALVLLVTALVFTIGFFTGGAGFAFMTPVFAAISAPFAAAATAWGIPLCVPALAGFCLTIAALNLPNTVKRFLGWLDSFKYDAAVDNVVDDAIQWSNKDMAEHKVAVLKTKLTGQCLFPYNTLVTYGIVASIGRGFSSPYEDKLVDEEEAQKKYLRENLTV